MPAWQAGYPVGREWMLLRSTALSRQQLARYRLLQVAAQILHDLLLTLLILIPFQDETNNATLSSWQDHEEPMSSWSHPLGRLCSKPRTSGNSGKPWRCC